MKTASAGPALGFGALMRMAPVSLAAAALLATASAALSLAPFWMLYRIALELAAAQPDVAQVRHLALLALALVLARWLLMALSHGFAHWGAFAVLYRLRLALAQRLLRVPMGFFARQGSGVLRKTVIDDTQAMEGFLAHMLPDASAAATVPLAALALLFMADWRLALASLVPLPVALLFQIRMLRGSAARMHEWHEVQGRIAGRIVEYLRGMPVVKVFGLSARAFGDFAQAIEGTVHWVERYASSSAAGWAVFVGLLTANLVVVAPLAAWLHARGEVDTATVLLFLLVAPAVLQPLLRLTFAFGEQARRAEALLRLNTVLQAPTLAETPAAPNLPVPTEPHGIAFENVGFSYEGRGEYEAPALNTLGFEAPAGGVTALVGPSGSGKSTIARLVPRLFDVNTGCVRVAGHDVRDWPPDELLSRIAIVFQEVMLFHGTVRDNLRIARPDADEAALRAAARAARALDFIERLPQGWETPLGERGARLSGGERQRLSIARALLKDAPILLLDEATAHADAESEWLIQEALAEACRGRTVLMIAHRLQTVVDADHIVVLDAGRVAGQGRHHALLADCPLYRRLWDDQQQAGDWQLVDRRALPEQRP
ncbi:ATP-binding cassette domain-containing protein [Azoarcus indigens]|uniref:ATP-binding cassette subfamily B protein n=1 Tax=Azoarcus indigens TaxID=29545 RepID=A0A4R6DR15_9RHOO|nr:ABC transporter ATP-binding protein [Azoarcus indigens]NMG66854.1 ATP-binding cassette domain-containing protein [Azoarcus indigens]TDN46718.1 ATP-binding cassette subfamily B protein [Azoarcus indigens]